MFRRRDKIPFWGRVREFFAPRTGWRRALEYYSHRMKRLPDSPTRIALGFACGAYVSFTPFFGLHFIVAAALAWAIRANVFASAIGKDNYVATQFHPEKSGRVGLRLLNNFARWDGQC